MTKKRQRRVLEKGTEEKEPPNDTGGKKEPWRELPKVELARKLPGLGRPSKLTGPVLKQIETICMLEANPSYRTIAKIIGVKHTTFHAWLNEYRGLREQVDSWRQTALQSLRRAAVSEARNGDMRTLRWLLDRRDRDFKKEDEPGGVDAGASTLWSDDDETPDPTFL